MSPSTPSTTENSRERVDPAGSSGVLPSQSNQAPVQQSVLQNSSTTSQSKISKLRLWFKLASSGPIVRRALFYALVVGIILNVINHGPSAIEGSISSKCYVQMFLTACVPYAVSTLSSVQAMMQRCNDK